MLVWQNNVSVTCPSTKKQKQKQKICFISQLNSQWGQQLIKGRSLKPNQVLPPNIALLTLSWCNGLIMLHFGASLVVQRLKHLPAMWETWVRSLGQEYPVEKEMATHSSILAWRIPWTEELGGLQSMSRKKSDMTEWLHFHFGNAAIINYLMEAKIIQCA